MSIFGDALDTSFTPDGSALLSPETPVADIAEDTQTFAPDIPPNVYDSPMFATTSGNPTISTGSGMGQSIFSGLGAFGQTLFGLAAQAGAKQLTQEASHSSGIAAAAEGAAAQALAGVQPPARPATGPTSPAGQAPVFTAGLSPTPPIATGTAAHPGWLVRHKVAFVAILGIATAIVGAAVVIAARK